MFQLLIRSIALTFLFLSSGHANLGNLNDSGSEHSAMVEGKVALQEENWSAAINIFEGVLEQLSDSADVHNFLGYAHRKSGDIDKALEHYEMALEINPDHKSTLEYLGEAYISLGDLERANAQLSHLKSLCTPIPCEELKELEQALLRATK
jgi:tetratricopeptide (TPR) repeat protein